MSGKIVKVSVTKFAQFLQQTFFEQIDPQSSQLQVRTTPHIRSVYHHENYANYLNYESLIAH